MSEPEWELEGRLADDWNAAIFRAGFPQSDVKLSGNQSNHF